MADNTPGDPARPGDDQVAENVCRDCGGSGRLDGVACPACDGSGKVLETVGDA